MLCAKLVERLTSMQSFAVAYFFASPHARSGGEPEYIVRSWIAQLTRLDPEILELAHDHSKAGRRASKSESWSLFEAIVTGDRRYVFVVDGFDEYDRLEDARASFLQDLKKATRGTGSRILISSRNETDIEAELSPAKFRDPGHNMLQCRVRSLDVRHDISLFSRSIVDKKLPNKDDRLRQELADELIEKCEGMFLWIKLQQDQLRGTKNAKQLHNTVRNMPSGLTNTYERNWKRIRRYPADEQHRALAILRWAAFGFWPLTVSEMVEALIVEPNEDGSNVQLDDLPDEIDDEYIDREIIDVCGSLVEARAMLIDGKSGDKTVHLIHASVKDFLVSISLQDQPDTFKSYGKYDQTHDTIEHHEYLAEVCLGYLDNAEVWRHNIMEEGLRHVGSFLHYAASHWTSHVNAAGTDLSTWSYVTCSDVHLLRRRGGDLTRETETSRNDSKHLVKTIERFFQFTVRPS